jgi:LysR family glycine cleavage system transcriptional activator
MPGLGSLPSIENLQCFLAAAEHLSFRRAAASVALTPTAFGQRIKQLEEQLGCVLFERTTRSVKLTERGAALQPRARETLDLARACLDSVHDEAPPVTFVVGSRYELAETWIAPILGELDDTHPHWRIHMYCGSGSDILKRLVTGEVDCVVTSAPVARSGWNAEVLHPETYCLVAAPSLLDRVPLESAEDCQQHTLLDVDAALPLTRYLTAAPGPLLDFARERYLGSGGAMLEVVLSGGGIAVLPQYMVREHIQMGTLRHVLPERELLSDTFRLIYKATTPLESVFKGFAAALRAHPLR